MKVIKTMVALAISGCFLTGAANAARNNPSVPPGFGPDANPPGAIPYAKPVFWIDSGSVKQTLSVSGCKKLSEPAKGAPPLTTGNVTFFDDSTFVLYTDWETPVALTGEWSKISSTKTNTFYMTFNTASMVNLITDLEVAGLKQCQTTKPAMTAVKILEPSNLISKNTIVVKVVNNLATGKLTMTAKSQTDPKVAGTFVNGKTTMTLTISGQMYSQP